MTTRGFTGHEHVDGVGVIHMNGRIFDPSLGRFLQVDPFVQEPGNPQSWNAYTYVFNNPLRYTDPTGMLGVEERQWLGAIVAIAMVAIGRPEGLGQVMAYAMASGFVSGAITTQSFRGGVMGAMTAVVTAGVGGNLMNANPFLRVGMMAFTGGVMGQLQGGNFGSSFLSAGLTAGVMPQVGKIINDVGRTLVGALAGGTISELTGGKFASGAVNGAIQAAMSGVDSGAGQDQDQLSARRVPRKWTVGGVRRILERSDVGNAFLKEYENNPLVIIGFERATDTYVNIDGGEEVKELNLAGSYNPNTKAIRINASLSNEQAALTFFHEYRHHLGANELDARILTEQFAIDAGLKPSAPGYRTEANTVNVEAIQKQLAPGALFRRITARNSKGSAPIMVRRMLISNLKGAFLLVAAYVLVGCGGSRSISVPEKKTDSPGVTQMNVKATLEVLVSKLEREAIHDDFMDGTSKSYDLMVLEVVQPAKYKGLKLQVASEGASTAKRYGMEVDKRYVVQVSRAVVDAAMRIDEGAGGTSSSELYILPGQIQVVSALSDN